MKHERLLFDWQLALKLKPVDLSRQTASFWGSNVTEIIIVDYIETQ